MGFDTPAAWLVLAERLWKPPRTIAAWVSLVALRGTRSRNQHDALSLSLSLFSGTTGVGTHSSRSDVSNQKKKNGGACCFPNPLPGIIFVGDFAETGDEEMALYLLLPPPALPARRCRPLGTWWSWHGGLHWFGHGSVGDDDDDLDLFFPPRRHLHWMAAVGLTYKGDLCLGLKQRWADQARACKSSGIGLLGTSV